MSTEALAPSHEPRVAEVPPPAGAPPIDVAPSVPIRIRLAEALHQRGVGPGALLLFALAFAVAAALVLLVDHPGMAAVLGAVALAGSVLATVPADPTFADVRTLARAAVPMVNLLFVAGLVGGLAGHTAPVVMFLALLVFLLEAWLPLLRAVAGPLRLADDAGLWTRVDRLAVLLLGALIGRTGPALLFVAAVGLLDAWLRVERLGLPSGVRPEIEVSWLRHVIQGDGRFVPAVRWTTLALAVVALFLLPASTTWRF